MRAALVSVGKRSCTKLDALVSVAKRSCTELDLSGICLPFHNYDLIDDNPLVDTCKAYRGATRVVVDNCSEWNDLWISRFRHHMPLLQQLNVTNMDATRVEDWQLLKYVALGVEVVWDFDNDSVIATLRRTARGLATRCAEHLSEQDRRYLADLPAADVMRSQWQARDLLSVRDAAQKRATAACSTAYAAVRATHQAAYEALLARMATWTAGHPRVLADWPTSHCTRELHTMYGVITELALWPHLDADPGEGGYAFSSDARWTEAVFRHPAVEYCGHSGMSEAFCMRDMQGIRAAGGFTAWRSGRE